MVEQRFLAIDTETTRLPRGSRMPEIVQIAMIRGHLGDYDAPTIEHELVLTLDPDVDPDVWQDEAIAVHGISREDVEGAPTMLEVFPRIWEVASGAEILVGYNLGFDSDVLAAELVRFGLARHFPWPRRHVDVMPMAMHRLVMDGKRGQKAPTLSEIYMEVMGAPMVDAHDALADIKATVDVWHRMTR